MGSQNIRFERNKPYELGKFENGETTLGAFMGERQDFAAQDKRDPHYSIFQKIPLVDFVILLPMGGFQIHTIDARAIKLNNNKIVYLDEWKQVYTTEYFPVKGSSDERKAIKILQEASL